MLRLAEQNAYAKTGLWNVCKVAVNINKKSPVEWAKCLMIVMFTEDI